jgi:ferric-dicitrate binding protein FerR (iron transport regulator)
VLLRLTRRRGKYLRTTVTANGKRMRVRRNVAYVRLAVLRGTVRVRVTQTRRFRGKVQTFRATMTLRVCRR